MQACQTAVTALSRRLVRQHAVKSRIRPAVTTRKQFFNTSKRTFEEGDDVLLIRSDKPDVGAVLITKLKKGGSAGTPVGSISHDSIIGATLRSAVTERIDKNKKKGKKGPKGKPGTWRALRPSLAEYVTLSPRIVTPIYPSDASLLVSLLDLNVSPSNGELAGEAPRLDILEAGTGHGSLTLYLSRAIHAANPPLPLLPMNMSKNAEPIEAAEEVLDHEHMASNAPPITDPEKNNSIQPTSEMVSTVEETAEEELKPKIADQKVALSEPVPTEDPAQIARIEQWKQQRKAIIHTVDVSERHSKHAEKVVAGFRNGIYAQNIDFHVGSVDDFIDQEYQKRYEKQQIFDHIFLDLPGVHSYMTTAARALRSNGYLMVFAPSVTQIARCVEMIRRNRLPLSYDDVIELGPGYTGGKSWDVRAVRPSRLTPGRTTPAYVTEAYFSGDDAAEKLQRSENSQRPNKLTFFGRIQKFLERWFGERHKPWPEKTAAEREEQEWVMVCRPRVGGRIVGGGFVGIWRRKDHWEPWEVVEREAAEASESEKDGRAS